MIHAFGTVVDIRIVQRRRNMLWTKKISQLTLSLRSDSKVSIRRTSLQVQEYPGRKSICLLPVFAPYSSLSRCPIFLYPLISHVLRTGSFLTRNREQLLGIGKEPPCITQCHSGVQCWLPSPAAQILGMGRYFLEGFSELTCRA